jgi:hypothetical protein
MGCKIAEDVSWGGKSVFKEVMDMTMKAYICKTHDCRWRTNASKRPVKCHFQKSARPTEVK